MEDKKEWDEIIKEDIANMKDMLDKMQSELLKYPGTQGWAYLKPLRYMTVEVLRDLYKLKTERIEGVDDIIESI